MDTIQTRARIRKLRETGDIPCDAPDKRWAGRGRERSCAACGEVIATHEVEYEIDLRSGVTMRLHLACHTLWLEECEQEEGPLPRTR